MQMPKGVQPYITKQNPNREMEIEVPHEDVTLRTLSNEDTSERLIQKIDGTPQLSSNSPDSDSNKFEDLEEAASEKTIIQEQPDQQEAHLKQTQHSEQQQEQKQQQQGYQEQQPKLISVTSDKKP